MEEFEHIFITFIEALDRNNVRYCVLRGYELLPKNYSNDIDFGIHPDDKDAFFISLKEYKSNQKIGISIRNSRLEVLKLSFNNQALTVDFDFWFGFNYVGFEYLDIRSMMNNYFVYNGFRILSVENELSLSFLKELLHNKILRKDKAELLNSKLRDCDVEIITPLFNPTLKAKFIEAIQNRQYLLSKLSFDSKKELLINQLSINKAANQFAATFKFFLYRFYPSINPLYIKLKSV